MENIEWRRVPGFSRYEASNTGLIKSFVYEKFGRVNILSTHFNTDGYRQLKMSDDNGKTRVVRVHRIIADTFLPRIEGKYFVNHINSDRGDNNVSNLEWCSSSENAKHGYINGFRSSSGERHPRTNIKNSTVLSIRKEWKELSMPGDKAHNAEIRLMLSKKYGLKMHQIYSIISGRTWSNLKETDTLVFNKTYMQLAINGKDNAVLTSDGQKFFIGVDTYNEDNMAYCLARELNGVKEIINIKKMRDKDAFEQEVNNIAKYFEAVVIREY